MTSIPPFGLLLDVDGPIASPIDRAIVQPTIVPDLVALMNLGIPVVFNTGRSDEFLRHEVVEPLQEAGIPEGARLFGVCEKGAVWFAISNAGLGEIEIDTELATPSAYGKRIELLVEQKYSDTMFFDHTKRAMVSVEQHVHVKSETYLEARGSFDGDALQTFVDMGIGARLMDHEVPDGEGNVAFRVDPTIISTDIESVVLGKDRGAERALHLLSDNGALPATWRTVGDSRTDYAMADWLHANGYDVAHVDVRPADGVPEKPYQILLPATTVNDEAGALYLHRLVDVINGIATSESQFDA